MKLRGSGNPEDVRKVFVMPDLTPTEQAKNKTLRAVQLVEAEQYEYSIIKAAVINCQSIRSKRHLLIVLLMLMPNLVFGTESWLSSSLYSSEIFLYTYNII